jgi:chemotaxis protein histidine kinase CheA/ActR/RegA family two-component response regulator
MQLDDLLAVLRSEVAQAADDVDSALAQWMAAADPTEAEAYVTPIAETFDKLAQVSRMVGLEGHALATEQMRDATLMLAMSDPDEMAAGLGWIALWREPFTAVFESFGRAENAATLVDYLGMGPSPLPPELGEDLRQLLCCMPQLPRDDAASRAAQFADPQPADVSIEISEDIDADLLETFLADAPEQLARLAGTVRALTRGPVDAAELAEAQRVAHTFKGSGNIIGIRGVGKLAHRIEDLIDFAQAQGAELPSPMARDLARATATLDQMVYALRGDEDAPTEALADLVALTTWARAIDDGTWPERVAQVAGSPAAAPAAVLAAPRSRTPETPRETMDGGKQIRVDETHVEALMRRAGQSLVQQARANEQLRGLDARLAQLTASQHALDVRMRELQAQIDRQGVTLQNKAQSEGAGFDSLELDRFNELHSLARLTAEMLTDGQDLTQSARSDVKTISSVLLDQERALKQQHALLTATRLVAFGHIAARLQRNIAQTCDATGKQVDLVIEGESTRLDTAILDRLTEPLLHLLRNAVDHGIEAPEHREMLGKQARGTITLNVAREGSMLRVQCSDDGAGLDLPAIHDKAVALGLIQPDVVPEDNEIARLILLPGFSTRATVSDVSGRGVGLDVVAERVRAMKGRLEIATQTFEGTIFTLRVPASTGVAHALIVETGGCRWALPTDRVVTALPAVLVQREGELVVGADGRWSARSLAELVGLEDTADRSARAAVVVRGTHGEVALEVDRVLETRELVLQETGSLLRQATGVAGGAVLADGHIIFVLDVDALTARPARVSDEAARSLRRRAEATRKSALVVDDSHSVRKTVSQLLADAGYEVRTARDGLEAIEALTQRRADIVLTDLEMPNLNGLEMTRQLRERIDPTQLPIVMLTSRDSDKHRASARAAGVSHYLTKPYTDGALLGVMRNLLAFEKEAATAG